VNRSELIKAVTGASGLTHADITRVFEELENTINDTLSKGEGIQWLGLLKFEVKDRPERQAVKPGTTEKITVPAKRVVKVTPFKKLSEAVAASG